MSERPTCIPKQAELNWVQSGTDHAETVVLIHAVGHDLTYWDRQIEALHSRYNVVAFDLPGHGRSPATAQDLSLKSIVDVVVRLIETVSSKPICLAGISFGGMVAQAVTLARPDLVGSLILIGTTSTFPETVRNIIRSRANLTRAEGMAGVLQSSLERWFTPKTREQRPDIIDRISKTVLADDPQIHARIWDLIADEFDVHARLAEIQCPTLVLVGAEDASTPPHVAAQIAEGIRGSRLVMVPHASHIVTVEAPEAVNREISQFLTDVVYK